MSQLEKEAAAMKIQHSQNLINFLKDPIEVMVAHPREMCLMPLSYPPLKWLILGYANFTSIFPNYVSLSISQRNSP